MRNHAIRLVQFICLVPILLGFCIPKQGIIGFVLLEKNASMPLKGAKGHKGLPISTTVYIYEAANINQLIGQEGNYAKGIDAKLIKQVLSKNDGKFKVKIAPGKYTILLGYQNGIYIPYFSGNTGVAFVEVLKGQFQEIDLSINASSIY
jgi:hypothetical protein